MASILENRFRASASATALSEAFRIVTEDHLEYFRTHPLTRTTEVSTHDTVVYRFDWIGLLNKLGIPTDVHWLTIRMNGGFSYTDLFDNGGQLLIPDLGEFNKIMQMHVSARRKK